jgi:DNA-binding PadR family transcriptional regulator
VTETAYSTKYALAADEQAVLDALAQYTLRAGHRLSEMTGLGPHRLYPALYALERKGLIVGEWADMPKPRLRRYKLVSGI